MLGVRFTSGWRWTTSMLKLCRSNVLRAGRQSPPHLEASNILSPPNPARRSSSANIMAKFGPTVGMFRGCHLPSVPLQHIERPTSTPRFRPHRGEVISASASGNFRLHDGAGCTSTGGFDASCTDTLDFAHFFVTRHRCRTATRLQNCSGAAIRRAARHACRGQTV